MIVRALELDDHEVFVDHVRAHLGENGVEGTPLFTPNGKHDPFDIHAQRARFREALVIEVGRPGWMRVWGAFERGALVGHVDLRARHEPSTGHRALLGLGIRAPYRGRGIGRVLIKEALAWARTQPLAWVDLFVFASNTRAQTLYESFGFSETGRTRDLFRVDGQSIDDVAMTLQL